MCLSQMLIGSQRDFLCAAVPAARSVIGVRELLKGIPTHYWLPPRQSWGVS